MTVRQTVQDLAAGTITLQRAIADLEGRTDWDPDPQVTAAQLFGMDDVPPAGDNHPDQINLVAGLTQKQRDALWLAAGRAGIRP